MKKITLIIILAFAQLATAQEPFDFFLRIGNDPNMMISGAYPDRQEGEKAIGLHNKYGFGFEWKNTRLGMDLESFTEIGFTKWTYLYFDYKINDIIKNVNLFGGAEISQIKRHHPDFSYDQPDNYREYTINPLLFGLNGEIQYRRKGSFLAVGLQGNIHQAEDELKPYKKYRKQIFLNLYFYL